MAIQAQNLDERIEQVQQIADRIEMPTGEEEYIFPKYKKGKEIPEFLDYKKGNYVAKLDHTQDTLLGQIITKEVFGKNGTRYALLPLQSSYDRTHSDKNFKEMVKDYWIYNREVILQEGRIIPDPLVVERNGKLEYEGKSIKAEINTDDVFDTLIKAGLFKEPKKKVYKGSIYFKDAISSVGSDWGRDEGCFGAASGGPSNGSSGGVAAFEKTDKKAEKDIVEIATREYEEMMRKAKEYDKLLTNLEKIGFKPIA